MAEKTHIHYVASTHWDREWYLPFQGFRFLLVKLVDQLIDILESNPSYRHFVFDGQTVALSDYLDIRPENRGRLGRLIRDGRILVGPWYTMPDERIPGGESLIRNILRGYRDARDWGVEPMRYGYICDIFGHIAQMPAIFAGMGIDYALLGRGTNEHTHPAHFIWRSPDGSEVIAFKEQDADGYGVGRRLWSAAGGASGEGFDREAVLAEARRLREKEASRSDIPVQLWLDGVDHQRPGPRIPEALDLVREAMPDAEVVFSTLPLFAEDVRRYRDRMPVFEGELIDVAKGEGGYLYLISHCLSSYYPTKQANGRCQTALERWAEPLAVWTAPPGGSPLKGFLDEAWQFLLQNHPHDSICGCSIDQVHKDSEYRYDQCELIAREVANDCLAALAPPPAPPSPAAAGDCLSDGSPRIAPATLTVVNAAPWAGRRVVSAEFDYPRDFPRRRLRGFNDDLIPSFDIFDSEGGRVDYQLHRYIAPEQWLGFPSWGHEVERVIKVKVSFEADFKGIAARNFSVRPRQTSRRDLGTMRSGAARMENEFLKVDVAPDGTLSVTDKAAGRTFSGLCVFEDTGEIGDGWYHTRPVTNQTFLSTGFTSGISFVDEGSLVTTMRIEKTLMLPAGIDWALLKRRDERRPVRLLLDVTLRKGEAFVECSATLDNTVDDHRLRVLLATGIEGGDYFANQPFTFVKRRRGADPATFDWKENDEEEKNFAGIAGVADSRGGLAVACGEGLHEVAVKDDAEASIAVTLMRAFRRTVVPPYEGRSQLRQTMTFSWRIVPFSGPPDYAALTRLQQEFHAGTRCRFVRGEGREAGTFVAMRSAAAILSALKPAEDGRGAILRVFNPTRETICDEIVFGRGLASCAEVNHAEESLSGASETGAGGSISVTLGPDVIRSYRIVFA